MIHIETGKHLETHTLTNIYEHTYTLSFSHTNLDKHVRIYTRLLSLHMDTDITHIYT